MDGIHPPMLYSESCPALPSTALERAEIFPFFSRNVKRETLFVCATPR